MTERPILMSAEMVRAILDGRKMQTRRIMKPQPIYRENATLQGEYGSFTRDGWNLEKSVAREMFSKQSPFGQPGDRLWVRENFTTRAYGYADEVRVTYDASGEHEDSLHAQYFMLCEADKPKYRTQNRKRRPSIHMPRWASRITLEIVDVRVERLQEIHWKTEELEAEGVTIPPTELYPQTNRADKLERQFAKLWDSIYTPKRDYQISEAPFAWECNPWVWVVTFRRVKA